MSVLPLTVSIITPMARREVRNCVYAPSRFSERIEAAYGFR